MRSFRHLAARMAAWKINLYAVLLAGIFLLFIGCAVYFAFNLKLAIVPDENAHFTYSKHFATTWGTPPDVPETYRYGFIAYRPILYYWVNARILNALDLAAPSLSEKKKLVSLRLVNVFYSFVAFVYCYLLAREVIPNRWWRLLVVFLLANTLMFVFLSGGLNYDNLTNLCSFAAIYHLIRVVQGKSFTHNSLAWLLFLLVGALVKFTILPLALATVPLWAWYVLTKRKTINFRPVLDWKLILLAVSVLGLLAWNFALYGVNLIRFRAVIPVCEQVLAEDKCNLNPLSAREDTMFLEKKLNLQDILNGRASDPFEWFIDFWFPTMVMKVYGIMGHDRYYPNLIMTFYRLALIWAAAVAIRYWKKPSLAVGFLYIILIVYTLVLLRTNYDNELATGFFHPATQGRYIFPVIGVLYVLLVYAFMNITSAAVRAATVVLVVLLFVWGSPLSTFLQMKPRIFPLTGVPKEQLLDEIEGSDQVSQVFTSECKGRLEDVRLMLTTFRRANTHPVTVQLIDVATNTVVAENSRDGASVKNNAWNYFLFPALQRTNGKQYRIMISSPGSTQGDAISVWGSLGDSYLPGQAYMNDTPLGMDLTFQYRCVQSPLAHWFH